MIGKDKHIWHRDLAGGSVLAVDAGLLRESAHMKFRYASKGTVIHLNADSPSLARKSVLNKLPFGWERVHFRQSVRKTNSCPVCYIHQQNRVIQIANAYVVHCRPDVKPQAT